MLPDRRAAGAFRGSVAGARSPRLPCARMPGLSLALAMAIASGACALSSSGVVPTTSTGRGGVLPPGVEAAPPADAAAPRPAGGARPPVASGRRAPALANAVVASALAFVGTPYRVGGSTPDGFDCSGLARYVFNEHGIALPRTVGEQFGVGKSVDMDDVRAGDLLFFATSGSRASHVAIALGDGAFVHAPASRGSVRVESLSGRYWQRRLLGARRVIR